MTTVFSGIQPTGSLHLGNYMGAIKNWKPLIEKNQCIFCIVDMHAITMPYDKSLLHENIRKTLSSYIACGIDPSKTIIFKQSDVNEHTELAWILSCIVQYGKINGMIQFKEKSKQNSQKVSLGLYTYPILMAADILLYKTNYVPVGEDQTQHIELTREVASTFNKRYETTFFPIPSIITNKNSARIMSLKDGTKKMSKSDPSKHSRINLDDTPDEIKEKISKATTDSFDYVDYDTVNRPSLSNLISIYANIKNTDIESTVDKFKNSTYSNFKKDLTDELISLIQPISKKISELMNDKSMLTSLLEHGKEKASKIASKNIMEVKKIIGVL